MRAVNQKFLEHRSALTFKVPVITFFRVSRSALFFGREKKKVTRENFTKILDFGREKKKVPVKKGEKPLKSTRENHFLPVKIFGNLHP